MRKINKVEIQEKAPRQRCAVVTLRNREYKKKIDIIITAASFMRSQNSFNSICDDDTKHISPFALPKSSNSNRERKDIFHRCLSNQKLLLLPSFENPSNDKGGAEASVN